MRLTGAGSAAPQDAGEPTAFCIKMKGTEEGCAPARHVHAAAPPAVAYTYADCKPVKSLIDGTTVGAPPRSGAENQKHPADANPSITSLFTLV